MVFHKYFSNNSTTFVFSHTISQIITIFFPHISSLDIKMYLSGKRCAPSRETRYEKFHKYFHIHSHKFRFLADNHKHFSKVSQAFARVFLLKDKIHLLREYLISQDVAHPVNLINFSQMKLYCHNINTKLFLQYYTF